MAGEEFTGKTALVVDDASIIRIMLANVFAKHGISLAGEAKTGQEALAAYQQRRPDFVTMDITMPGLDGISTIREIMRTDPRARIIVVSALGLQSKIQQALQAGARDYLVKPIREDALISAVRRVLKRD
jgi:two-component system chemotaxis response regulator CheY